MKPIVVPKERKKHGDSFEVEIMFLLYLVWKLFNFF